MRNVAALMGAALLLVACGGSGDVGKELGLQNPELHFVKSLRSSSPTP